MKQEEVPAWNAQQLLKIDNDDSTGNVRDKVEFILMKQSVYYPAIIHRDVFRTPAEQLRKYLDKVSKVKWGYHCFERNGFPASLAADIVSSDFDYFQDKKFIMENTDEIFWLLLGSLAREVGLYWGGYFNLTDEEEKEYYRIFDSNKFELLEDMANKVAKNQKRMGFDPAHVETMKVSIGEAYSMRS